MLFSSSSQLRRYWPVWLTLALGLAVSAGLGWQLYRGAVELDEKRFALRIKDTVDQLDGRLEKTEALLLQLKDYLMFSGENRNRIFDRWCHANGLYVNCPWVFGVAVATNRQTAQWREKLPASPQKWTTKDWAQSHKMALEHPIECHIVLKSGTGGKFFLPDYQLDGRFTDPSRFAVAVRNGDPRISGLDTVMLSADTNELKGAVLFLGVYDPDVDDVVARVGPTVHNRATAARWLSLNSVILAPIDFNALEKAVWGKVAPDLGVELFSSKNQTAETWLNSAPGGPRAADPQFRTYLTYRLDWPMYGDRFSIFFYTTPLFEAQSQRRLARIAAQAGTAMTVLASALLGVALRARHLQELLTEQIREARDALATVQKAREKLSHDLHDNTVQALYALQLSLGHTSQKLADDPVSARRDLATARVELDALIAEMRRFITAEARVEAEVDLPSVLRASVERARAGASARIELHCDPGASDRLTGVQAVQLANIAREALSNSLRHAQARRVDISLRSESDAVCLEVSDDGVGFDPESSARQGVGLTSMTARTRDIGGTLDLHSAPGQGTRVAVRVPAAPPERDGYVESHDEPDEA